MEADAKLLSEKNFRVVLRGSVAIGRCFVVRWSLDGRGFGHRNTRNHTEEDLGRGKTLTNAEKNE